MLHKQKDFKRFLNGRRWHWYQSIRFFLSCKIKERSQDNLSARLSKDCVKDTHTFMQMKFEPRENLSHGAWEFRAKTYSSQTQFACGLCVTLTHKTWFLLELLKVWENATLLKLWRKTRVLIARKETTVGNCYLSWLRSYYSATI